MSKRKPLPSALIRQLSQRVLEELKAENPDLGSICKRPPLAILEQVKQDLIRVIAGDPEWYSDRPRSAGSSIEGWEPDALVFVLDDLIARVSSEGHDPAFVWCSLLELIQAGWAKAGVREPRQEGYYDRDLGEGRVVISVARDRASNVTESIAGPGGSPTQDTTPCLALDPSAADSAIESAEPDRRAPEPAEETRVVEESKAPYLKVVVNCNNSHIIIKGNLFTISEACAIYVDELVKAKGHPVSFASLKKKYSQLEGQVSTRLLKKLPKEVRALIGGGHKGQPYRYQGPDLPAQ